MEHKRTTLCSQSLGLPIAMGLALGFALDNLALGLALGLLASGAWAASCRRGQK